MSATDTIRAMLDERGVEYRTHGMTDRMWFDVGNISWFVIERDNGSLAVQAALLTPEQAIEATLGRGECRRVLYKPTGVLVCSECGAGIPKQLDKYCFLHYCPNCGRKVRA